MLSRVADSIYWMSRYVERAENVARFVDVTHNMTLDLLPGASKQWGALVYASGDHKEFERRYGEPTRDNVVRFLTFDTEYANSILSCLAAARENARSVRDAISSEMWEQLNQFYYRVRDAANRPLESPNEFFEYVRNASHLFIGITVATFSQDEGWHFARLGRMLERADKTSRILDVKYFILLPSAEDVGTPIDDLQWSAVLRSVGGFEMFRKRHRRITPNRVVEFLMLDRFFPRAVLHCVNNATRSLHAISGSPPETFCNIAEMSLGRLRSELAFLTVEDVINDGLHEFLDSLQTKLNEVGEGLHQTYIALEPDEEAINR